MFTAFMITGFRRPTHRTALGVLALFAALSCLVAAACNRVALLAPNGSTITLTTLASTLPLNTTTNIIAQVIEPAGTPPQKGTLVTFTTTLGSIEPVEAETDAGGRVMVTFNAGTRSGTATITALSGGVTTTTEGALKIPVGAAAATGVSLTAAPATISAGGESVISATITDSGGNLVPGVAVTFSTTNGSLNPSTASTDQNGTATTTLRTSRTAEVTATAGAATVNGTTPVPAPSAKITVTVEALPTAAITASENPQVGVPTTFTITAQPGAGSTSGIESVSVAFGDGSRASLGNASGANLQVQHVYLTPGAFTATVTVVDTNGGRASATTVVVVGGSSVVAVNLTSTQALNTPVAGQTTVTFTATVSPASIAVTQYAWTFGDGTTSTTTGALTQHQYPTGSGSRNVRVDVTTSTGQTGFSTLTVTP
jgi:hypothetical protein